MYMKCYRSVKNDRSVDRRKSDRLSQDTFDFLGMLASLRNLPYPDMSPSNPDKILTLDRWSARHM